MDNNHNNSQILLLLNILIGLLALVSISLIILTIFGYGTVRLALPNSATVRINGHLTMASSLRMRPGDYQIVVSSPLTMPYQATLHISLFRTLTYTPTLEPRSAEAIASSVIGATATGPPKLTAVRQFAGNWVVGQVVPGSSRLALHYDNNQEQWVVGFYNDGGYPQDTTKLPSDVAAYVQELGRAGN